MRLPSSFTATESASAMLEQHIQLSLWSFVSLDLAFTGRNKLT